jgi:hypothetical protein
MKIKIAGSLGILPTWKAMERLMNNRGGIHKAS